MKRFLSIVLLCAISLLSVSGCVKQTEGNKLKIIATLFPQYDFARVIAGDKAEVAMLLPTGADSHSYDPTPADIVNFNKADLFIYTGSEMEPWADKMVKSATDNVRVLDVSDEIELCGEHSHDDHSHLSDPHIWTSPKNAVKMVDNILKALCEIDSDNKEYYTKNAEAYKAKLNELDESFRSIVNNGKRKMMLFAGRFAMHYFAEEYGIEHVAAVDACTSDAQASTKSVAMIIDTVKSENIPVVYYEELADPKVAKMIADETGCKILLFHSCHNISIKEKESGATYLSLMQQNAENLKKGLN